MQNLSISDDITSHFSISMMFISAAATRLRSQCFYIYAGSSVPLFAVDQPCIFRKSAGPVWTPLHQHGCAHEDKPATAYIESATGISASIISWPYPSGVLPTYGGGRCHVQLFQTSCRVPAALLSLCMSLILNHPANGLVEETSKGKVWYAYYRFLIRPTPEFFL
ncbi:uncharacterized protein LACBIDRAFT_296685 [Laccaria bicolor S238N-H82]|uniref:Predicted protein n=1 Tax=Laccaria bicolor (strain S238N-H82 / ATCC MYA-4686) TaxID=486041 RepID=B0D830_LACBS|nr:uncharacterized protein LACBIDRAFT_296685 [Laccaria bicolor S238N-H82]EDR09004.1 predicted protein [Laccaria bicolor S238N-H82]|eukprot:XP_001880317.1 predicted protein [Laccaria bicolor S238N-H82]